MLSRATLALLAAASLAALAALAGLLACLPRRAAEAAPPPKPGKPLARDGDEIIVCGQLFHTGTKVVTWLDPGGYDAYRAHRWDVPAETLPKSAAAGCDTPSRLGAGRSLVAASREKLAPAKEGPVAAAMTLESAREQITQFVLHYDVAYTSANCFHVLHDMRGLSVHFMLDLDGTVYQTCDVKERARHAGEANDRSVGIEIAHPGPLTGQPALAARYKTDADGVYLELPATMRRGALPDGFKARPARPDPVRADIHGSAVEQYDFTDAQYEALARLTATLHAVLPKIRLDAPRGSDGKVLMAVLEPPALASFEGLIAHWHVTKSKIDPGPAFDWDRVLTKARRLAR